MKSPWTTLVSLTYQGCVESIPGLHQVPYDPGQRPDDGDSPTRTRALQVSIVTVLVVQSNERNYHSFPNFSAIRRMVLIIFRNS